MYRACQVSGIKVPNESGDETPSEKEDSAEDGGVPSLIESFAGRDSRERATKARSAPAASDGMQIRSKDKQKLIKKPGREEQHSHEPDIDLDAQDLVDCNSTLNVTTRPVEDFNQRIAEQQPDSIENPTLPTPLDPLSSHGRPQGPSPTRNKSQTEHSLQE